MIKEFDNYEIENSFDSLESKVGTMSTSALQSYLNGIKNFKNLEKEEESSLLSNLSKENKDKIINHHLKLVVAIVSKLSPYNYAREDDFLDLIQAGNIGLMKAVDTYDVSKNPKEIAENCRGRI